ncbi:MAG TPA: hypothetical protein VG248_02460, partial [Caulobacteraceae bacterium]|nr:hypothetical protein [Caulobacteraceae bacterium]
MAKGLLRRLVATAVLAAALQASPGWAAAPPLADQVDIDIAHPLRTFTPGDALGAAIDGMQHGEVVSTLTAHNIALMKSAGLRRVTYRSRPELGVEVWHWTDRGRWSDPARRQGYWTGDAKSPRTPNVTYGYALPRRGDSIDNANNQGFSRLDDGDPASFWKSNPYLDRRFTHLAQNRPQWIVVSFAKPVPVEAIRILWGTPRALAFEVQYWTGEDVDDADGRWAPFPHGAGAAPADGADQSLRLADAPIAVRFVRLLLRRSSETAPPGSRDIRDRLGYAVRELELGVLRPDGSLADQMRHGADKARQTQTNVSSTDPWHRAGDRDADAEQAGFDLIFGTGLNGGGPLMVPVGTFFDTPGNAAAEIAYLRRRGFPVAQVELGEEPDGQFIEPEDDADLYLETAAAIRRIAPDLQLGGPSLQGAATDAWPDPAGGNSWIGRFVARLKARGGLDQFQFFSFEHYAFHSLCGSVPDLLREETVLLGDLLDGARAAGVPGDIPWIISEYGFSPFSGRAMSELPSALLSADIVGHFLTRGGSAAYLFGYTPGRPENQLFPCAGYGDMMLFEADAAGRARWPMPMYFAQTMMLRDWAAPSGRRHQLLAATASAKDGQGRPFVTAYALRDEAGRISLMLINRDPARAHAVRVVLHGAAGPGEAFPAAGDQIVQYSPAQYAWLDAGPDSHPIRDEAPVRRAAEPGGAVLLPPMSLSV